ncbi:hypothetical protein BDZ45DRAFT_734636 [Acephala macrosclerotiorum]|nr:hypothetical protein BDZ45DRAFT_734636 [Acephala macrosclerotiorum]
MGTSKYGPIITGQIQIDIRFLSIADDVGQISQRHGTPTIVQLAHPGCMSPSGTGLQPPICLPSIPIPSQSTSQTHSLRKKS